MRTWKVIFVPGWRIGERGGGDGEVDSVDSGSFGLACESGCERMVTRGTKEFQLGHVEVSRRASQTLGEGAAMKVELPMWRVASDGVMVGVERVEFVGSVMVDMVRGVVVDGVVPGIWGLKDNNGEVVTSARESVDPGSIRRLSVDLIVIVMGGASIFTSW